MNAQSLIKNNQKQPYSAINALYGLFFCNKKTIEYNFCDKCDHTVTEEIPATDNTDGE